MPPVNLHVKELRQTFRYCLQVLQLTFPYRHHRPAAFSQQSDIVFITSAIALQFRQPIISVGSGNTHTRAVHMLMPEAAVHEYDLAARREDQVRASGKVGAVESIAITQPVQQAAHLHFRLHALGFDSCHYTAANFRRYAVNHDAHLLLMRNVQFLCQRE